MALTPEQVRAYRQQYGLAKQQATTTVAPPQERVARLRQVVQPQVQQTQKLTNWASDVPVLSQMQDFGIGVGSAIGNAGLGLGQAALKGGMGITEGLSKMTGGFLKADNSLAQRTYDMIEKGKQEIYQKPFEGNLETMSGKAGEVVGNLAPYFATGPATGATWGARLAQGATNAIPDVVTAAGQSKGDWKTMAATGLTSTVANTVFPGATRAQKVLTGAGVGYTGDVATGLAGLRGEDRTGEKAFIPGAGTLIGATTGLITSGKGHSKKNYEALEGLQSSNKTIDRSFKAADKSGVDIKKVLSGTDLLAGSVTKDGRIQTADAIAKIDDLLEPYEGVVGEVLRNENKSVGLLNLKLKALEVIDQDGLIGEMRTQAINRLNGDISDLARIADNQGNVPLYRVHDLKVLTNKLNAKSYLNPEANVIGKTLTRAFKEFVEQSTDAIDAKKYNHGLWQMYSVRDALTALDGKVVKRGRLGKFSSEAIGAYIGGLMAGGPGAATGAYAGNYLNSRHLQNTFGETGKQYQVPEDIRSVWDNITGKNIPNKQGGMINVGAMADDLAGKPNDQALYNAYNDIHVPSRAGGYDKLVEAGEMPREMIFQAGKDANKLKPNVAMGRINDYAGNLEKDIGKEAADQFRSMVDPNNVYMVNGKLPDLDAAADDVIASFSKDTVTSSLKNWYTKNLGDQRGMINPKAISDDLTGKSDKLIQEARKYKSAEEFVKGQGTPVYHGTTKDFSNFKQSHSGELGKGVYFYDTFNKADDHVSGNGRVVEAYFKGKLATIDKFREIKNKIKDNGSWTSEKTIKALEKEGYVGIVREEGNSIVYNIFDPKNIKTRSQLTDIWNRAQSTAPTTWDKVKKALGSDLPNKEGGFLLLPGNKIRLTANETGMLVKIVDTLDKGKPLPPSLAKQLTEWSRSTGFKIPSGTPKQLSDYLKMVITESSKTTRRN